MKTIAIFAVVTAICCQGAAEPEKSFAMSSLVLPQGVSYTLGPVTLTRVLETATSASKSGTTASERDSEESGTKKSVGTTTDSGSSSRFGSGGSLGGSIGGNSGGSGGFSLLGLLGINLDVGGRISNEDSNSSNSSSRNNSETSYGKSHQKENGSSSEFAEVEQYGSYHLKFSVVFKSKDLTDTFRVGGSNSRVILNGFSSPIPVPYLERQEPVLLGAEERVFFFDYPIADQLLLKDAKRFVAQGRRNAVTLSLTGDEFPVVSERTKENVISEITRLMKQSPNTVISVDFGDAQRLSPWRVRQRFPRSSGRRGQRVTVRQAFEALNESIAVDEDMSEESFVFDKSGRMTQVCDLPTVGMPIRGDLSLVAISAVENTEAAETIVRLPTADFLSRPLSDFTELHLVRLSLREVAQVHSVRPQQVASLVDEVLGVLETVKGAKELWDKLVADLLQAKTDASQSSAPTVANKSDPQLSTLEVKGEMTEAKLLAKAILDAQTGEPRAKCVVAALLISSVVNLKDDTHKIVWRSMLPWLDPSYPPAKGVYLMGQCLLAEDLGISESEKVNLARQVVSERNRDWSAFMDDEVALFWLGFLLDDDRDKYKYEKMAADRGFLPALVWVSGSLDNPSRYGMTATKLVYSYLTRAAEGGNAESQFNLGQAYWFGKGVAVDRDKAVYWWRRAAQQGLVDAIYQLKVTGN